VGMGQRGNFSFLLFPMCSHQVHQRFPLDSQGVPQVFPITFHFLFHTSGCPWRSDTIRPCLPFFFPSLQTHPPKNLKIWSLIPSSSFFQQILDILIPGIRNCNKVGYGSSRVSRLIYLVNIYLCGSQTCFEKKKQISTSNCLEPDSFLKFFHPPELGLSLILLIFKYPELLVLWFFQIHRSSRPTALFATLVTTRGFFFFWANFSSRSFGEDPEH
jgi:hypothetical protein